MKSSVACCATAGQLRALLRLCPAAVVQVRALALPSMFADSLRSAVAGVPYEVTCVVSSPEAVAPHPDQRPQPGEVLVFSRGQLLSRLDANNARDPDALLAILRAGVSPWLGRPGSPQWDDDESDPYAVIGVPPNATFDEVRVAWRRRLAEYHPDRFARAGVKIRAVAESESQKINAAFRAIETLRAGRT